MFAPLSQTHCLRYGEHPFRKPIVYGTENTPFANPLFTVRRTPLSQTHCLRYGEHPFRKPIVYGMENTPFPNPLFTVWRTPLSQTHCLRYGEHPFPKPIVYGMENTPFPNPLFTLWRTHEPNDMKLEPFSFSSLSISMVSNDLLTFGPTIPILRRRSVSNFKSFMNSKKWSRTSEAVQWPTKSEPT